MRVMVVVLLLMSMGCGKEHSGLPNLTLRIPVPLESARYNMLETGGLGAYAIIPEEGLGGIIIVNANGWSDFRAFDLLSTVDPDKGCIVQVDDSGLNLVDPCSGAKFFLVNGQPSGKPAKVALKEYYVSRQGRVLYITN